MFALPGLLCHVLRHNNSKGSVVDCQVSPYVTDRIHFRELLKNLDVYMCCVTCVFGGLSLIAAGPHARAFGTKDLSDTCNQLATAMWTQMLDCWGLELGLVVPCLCVSCVRKAWVTAKSESRPGIGCWSDLESTVHRVCNNTLDLGSTVHMGWT